MTKKFKKKIENKEAGVYVSKTNCPSCHSTDNLALYKHNDGSYSATCFGGSCGYTSPNWDYEGNQSLSRYREPTLEELAYEKEQEEFEEKYLSMLPSFEEVRDDFVSDSLKDRKIPKSVLEFYGVKTDVNDKGEVYREFYPTYRDKKHVGYKIRSEFTEDDPEVKKNPKLLGVRKNFKGTLGDAKKGTELFGQHLFSPEKHKRLFITEGQIDAMTGYYATSISTKAKQGYAFVSLQGGAGDLQGLKDNLEYISSFEGVYLCFDKDEAGDKLLEKALKVLPVGKVKIMSFPKDSKDLNEEWQKITGHTKDRLAKEIYNLIWSAKNYCPAGIKTLDEEWEKYTNRENEPKIPFPRAFGNLNERTFGGYPLRKIINVAAPTSAGKTTFMSEMVNTILEESPYNLGVISIEDTFQEYQERMLSLRMSKHLSRIPLEERDWEAERKALDEMNTLGYVEGGDVGLKRLKFFEHSGGIRSGEDFWSKMKFLASGLDCRVIIVDPIQLLLAMAQIEDDEFSSELAVFVNTYNVTVICVHHIVKSSTSGTANSEGGDIKEESLKGSGSLIQVAHMTILLNRNKVHENELIRNTIKIKVSKCRFVGSCTGVVGYSFYNDKTGRLEYGSSPEEILEQEEYEGSSDFEFEIDNEKPINNF